jgi:hypothetical protein
MGVGPSLTTEGSVAISLHRGPFCSPTTRRAVTIRVDRRFAMDTPSAQATYADDRLDRDDVDAHHHPVPRAGRSVAERWSLSLLSVLLVGLMGLLGWTRYALSTVKAELREVQAHVRQLHASVAPREPRSPGGEAAPEATAQRLHALDQRLSAVESWTQDTAPRLTALEQRPREKAAKPPAPSPPPPLPPATQLPRNGTSAPQSPQDHQAYRDMRQQAGLCRNFHLRPFEV